MSLVFAVFTPRPSYLFFLFDSITLVSLSLSLGTNNPCAPAVGFAAGTTPLAIKHVGKAAASGAAAASAASGGGGGGGYAGKSWSLSPEDRRVLKRRTILARFTPIVLLSSFVGDLDLITDWTFLHYGLADQG